MTHAGKKWRKPRRLIRRQAFCGLNYDFRGNATGAYSRRPSPDCISGWNCGHSYAVRRRHRRVAGSPSPASQLFREYFRPLPSVCNGGNRTASERLCIHVWLVIFVRRCSVGDNTNSAGFACMPDRETRGEEMG